MREYDDDNIRLYAPVLQRVIILAAVVIAVPVMMWTITTFIRSYVARPQVPTFQRLTLSEAAQSPPPSTPLAASPPPPSAAPPAPAAALADTGRTAGRGPTPSVDTGASTAPPATGPSLSPPPGPVMAGAAVENPAQGGSPTAPVPIASPDVGGLPTVAKPAGLADRLATDGSGTTASAPASPNANASAPRAFGAPEPAGTTTETASMEALPPPRPIKGRVPLPPRRPAAIALAATEDMAPRAALTDTSASSDMASTDALPPPQPIKGRIPLPRRRPAVALAATGTIAPPAPIGHAVPVPKTRPVEASPDPPPAAHGAPYGYQPGLDSAR